MDERPPGDVLMSMQERSRYQVALHTTATRECECEKDNKGSGNCRIDQRQSHVPSSAVS
jgi:hypothetical protein